MSVAGAVIVVGGGGHARVLIEALRVSGTPIAGIVDTDPRLAGTSLQGIPVAGEEALEGVDPKKTLLVNGVGSVRLPVNRRLLYERLKGRGFRFATVVHPSAVVASDVVLGEGTQVMAGAVLQPGCRTGENCLINTRASLDHDCSLGSHVHVAPGVTVSGDVVVGAGAHIGTGATLIQGIAVGRNALIAAGAVVVKDVGEDATVMGVPGKEVKR